MILDLRMTTITRHVQKSSHFGMRLLIWWSSHGKMSEGLRYYLQFVLNEGQYHGKVDVNGP